VAPGRVHRALAACWFGGYRHQLHLKCGAIAVNTDTPAIAANPRHVLVVDDDPDIRNVLGNTWPGTTCASPQ